MIYLFALQLMQQSTWWCNNYSVWTNWLQFSPFSIFFFLFSFPFCFYFLFHFPFWINWTPWLLLSTVNLGSNMKLGKIIVWVFCDIWAKLIYHKSIPSRKWNLLQKYSINALMEYFAMEIYRKNISWTQIYCKIQAAKCFLSANIDISAICALVPVNCWIFHETVIPGKAETENHHHKDLYTATHSKQGFSYQMVCLKYKCNRDQEINQTTTAFLGSCYECSHAAPNKGALNDSFLSFLQGVD